jgi:hypothetical protein
MADTRVDARCSAAAGRRPTPREPPYSAGSADDEELRGALGVMLAAT